MYELSNNKFQAIKLYCKVTNNIEDDMIKMFIDSAAKEITSAVSMNLNPSDLENDPRFFILLQRAVKELYEVRGESVEGNRTFLTDKTYSIINQIRGDYLENSENE